MTIVEEIEAKIARDEEAMRQILLRGFEKALGMTAEEVMAHNNRALAELLSQPDGWSKL